MPTADSFGGRDSAILFDEGDRLVRKSAYDYEYTEVLEVNHG